MDPKFSSTSYTPDRLLYNTDGLRTGEERVASGNNLTRGTVLGKITGTLGATASGANTGDGTVSGEAMGDDTEIGAYVLTCVETATDGGRFSVVTPSGDRLEDAEVGVAYSNSHLSFTIADGDVDFAADDTFTITIGAGSGDVVAVDDTAVDGSEHPVAVLAQDTDASDGALDAPVYYAGEFNEDSLTFGGDDVPNDHRDALRQLGIFIRKPVSA